MGLLLALLPGVAGAAEDLGHFSGLVRVTSPIFAGWAAVNNEDQSPTHPNEQAVTLTLVGPGARQFSLPEGRFGPVPVDGGARLDGTFWMTFLGLRLEIEPGALAVQDAFRAAAPAEELAEQVVRVEKLREGTWLFYFECPTNYDQRRCLPR